jgi:hypothetical protein
MMVSIKLTPQPQAVNDPQIEVRIACANADRIVTNEGCKRFAESSQMQELEEFLSRWYSEVCDTNVAFSTLGVIIQ